MKLAQIAPIVAMYYQTDRLGGEHRDRLLDMICRFHEMDEMPAFIKLSDFVTNDRITDLTSPPKP